MKDKLYQYYLLMRADKPIGFLLLLWPVLWSLLIAGQGRPSIKNLAIFSLGCFLMRSAGCVINDIADRKIDKYVQRTSDRPLTTGRVKVKEALWLCSVLCLCAFVLVLMTNVHTVLLSIVALVLALIYPFSKRWFVMPQLFLGAAFSWGVVMAFAAEQQTIDMHVLLLYLAVVLWVISYDTFYALVDRDDDLKIGVKSSAIFFDKYDRLITAALQIFFIFIMLLVAKKYQVLSPVFIVSLTLVSLLFVYQQVLIKDYDREKCFQAFLNNNKVGLLVLLGIWGSYYLS